MADQVTLKPFKQRARYTIKLEFPQQPAVTDRIERLSEVQVYYIGFTALIQVDIDVMQDFEQLAST